MEQVNTEAQQLADLDNPSVTAVNGVYGMAMEFRRRAYW
jgi:hypothetical protein